MALALSWPTWGPRQLSDQLALRGTRVAESTVYRALRRLGLGTRKERLGAAGSFLGALSLDLVAQQFPSSQVGLTPLALLLGESEPGLVTRMVVSGWEGLVFGIGVVLGVTRRPRGSRATLPPA